MRLAGWAFLGKQLRAGYLLCAHHLRIATDVEVIEEDRR